MTPLLVQFLSEARDLIEESVTGLLALEENPGDGASMNRLFRSVHTLKGSSGLFEEYGVLTRVLHAGEDLLDTVRAGKLELNGEMVDQLLSAMDRIGAWLSAIEHEEKLPDWAEPEGKALTEKLRAWIATAPDKTQGGAQAQNRREIPWLAELPQGLALPAFIQAVTSRRALVALRYLPDSQCFFRGDDPLLQVLRVPDLLALHVDINDPWPESGMFDPFLCNLRFIALSLTPRAVIEEMFLYLPDQVEIVEIPPEALIRPRGFLGNPAQFTAMIEQTTLLVEKNAWAELIALVQEQLAQVEKGCWQAALLRWLGAIASLSTPDGGLLRTLIPLFARSMPPGLSEDKARVGGKNTLGKGSAVEKTMFLAILKAQLALLDHPCPMESRVGRMASIRAVLAGCFTRLGREKPLAAMEKAMVETCKEFNFQPLRHFLLPLVQEAEGVAAAATEEGAPVQPEVTTAAQPEKGKTVTLRVDQERIDRIMNLTGELVVAKNAIPFLAREAEEVHNVRSLSRKLKEQYGVINRIAEELQSAVMQVRMMPVSTIFQRFPRLVRDLSRKLDKQINLVIEGEETEADKNVIEELSDPLIHLVRNSIDHGIELPDDREEAGKPRSGTIRLSARQEGDEVILEITDDGKGIDPEVVRRKAVDKGLLDAENAAALTEEEATRLVLRAGFSTAERITDLSGRGVGMDVVSSAIAKTGGTLDLESHKGKGTMVRLTLPMTMAVTQVMMVEENGAIFGIPFDLVVETVRAPQGQISRIKDEELVVLRGRLVPLKRLSALLGFAPGEPRPLEAVLVVRHQGEYVGLVVGDFLGGVDIILKRLDGLFAGLSHLSGTALLGDGNILQVLDLKELL